MFKRFALLSLVLSIVVNPVFAVEPGESESGCDQITESVDAGTGATGGSSTTSGPTGGGV